MRAYKRLNIRGESLDQFRAGIGFGYSRKQAQLDGMLARMTRRSNLTGVYTNDVLTEENFLSIGHARRRVEETFGDLIPEPGFRTNGPATYYQIPRRQQRIGFIGAMTNLHFCETCNKLRLTCDGKLRPCLGSALEFDIMQPMREGASDEELRRFFLNVVERKPAQHDFRENYQPGRKMIAIGG